MKILLSLSLLLISTAVMADRIAAYYDDAREDNGKVLGDKRVCYYKNPSAKGVTFDIFRLIPKDKECPLVVYLGEQEKKD